MDSASAARYLQPRRFVIALAAATASLGDLGPRAHPLLYALVADEVGLLHAVPLPSSPSQKCSTSSRTFSGILCIAHSISFRADPHLAEAHGLQLPITRVRTVDQALRVVLESVLRSPDGLHRAAELIDPQKDSAMCAAYELDGVVGCFLRKVCIAFASLNFDALSRLLHDLRLFVHPNPAATIPTYTARASLPAPNVAREAAFALAKGLPVESDDEFTACTNLFEESRHPVTATNLAIHSLPDLGREHRAVMALPPVEYVVQLEAQRRKDLATSVDALHRYFDLSLVEIGLESHKANAKSAQDWRSSQRRENGTPNDAQGHQYAALSLGVLHAQFGNPEYASVALDDTIRAAQHCNDEACQARALSWIARTSSSVARRHQLLSHANDQLALAREEICTVFTPVSDGVPDSVSLHSAHGSGSKHNRNRDGSMQGRISSARIARIQKRISYRKPESRVESLLMSAAAWESHAAAPAALSVAKMALSFAERMDKDRLSSSKARALAAVASLTALEGDFETAASLLQTGIESAGGNSGCGEQQGSRESSTNVPETELLSRTLLWLRFERYLRQGDTLNASKLCETLTGLSSCAQHTTMSPVFEDLLLDATEARCRVHLSRQASRAAAAEADVLCRQAAGLGRPGRVVEGLRLRAEAQLGSGSAAAALPAVLAAASLSGGLGMSAAHARSALTLAETLLRLGEAGRAADALRPVMAEALGGLGAAARARAMRLAAEARMAQGGRPHEEVVRLLQDAGHMYQRCEDGEGERECWYLLARVHHCRGEREDRNRAARRFHKQTEVLGARRACLFVTGA